MIEVDDFKAFDANEVAEMLDLKYRTVTRYIQAGKIRARKIGKKYFVTERDGQAFILAQTQTKPLLVRPQAIFSQTPYTPRARSLTPRSPNMPAGPLSSPTPAADRP